MVVSGMARIPIFVVRDKQMTLKFYMLNGVTRYSTYADSRNVQITSRS